MEIFKINNVKVVIKNAQYVRPLVLFVKHAIMATTSSKQNKDVLIFVIQIIILTKGYFFKIFVKK